MKQIVAVITILFLTITAFSQNQGKVSGNINTGNNLPVENATVSLLRSKDSAIIKTALPDAKGNFEFEQLKTGSYLVAVSLVGYKKYYSAIFTIGDTQNDIKLSAITLQANNNQLGDVTVQARKPFIERKADRYVVNVESSITAAGSTALEILEKAPGVMVNQESGLNIKGKAGVTVMIDGKPSPLSGADLINYLKSIPSANIERIDIITNPSAKYDASGNAGIIDIRFKKDKRDGYNGNIGINYGQGVYEKPSINGAINFRNKKWNLFTTNAFNAPKTFTDFHITRKFFAGSNLNGPVQSIFDQKTFTRQPQKSYNMRTGADFYASKKTVIGVLLNTTLYNGTRDGNSLAEITNANGVLQFTNNTRNLLKDKRYNLLGNFNFKHVLDSTGSEINADIDMGKFHARPRQDIFIKTYDASGNPQTNDTQKSDQESTITVNSIKVDYTRPYGKTARLEAGLKSSIVKTDNDVKFFSVVNGVDILDVNRSNQFVYTENVNAAYTSFSKDFTKNSIQLGLRVEHTNAKGNQITTGQKVKRNYVQWFPNASASQKLNENNEISIAYSKRIDRPTYRQLNPFKLLVDNYTYVLGDPYLNPVITHQVQLGYTFQQKYNATFSYTRSTDAITDVFVQDDATKISSQIPANMQTFQQYDLSINIPFNIKRWMTSNFSGSVNYSKYNSPLQGGNLENKFTAWDFNTTNNFIIGKKGWSAELNAFYQSKSVWGQFIIRNLAQVSLGIQKISANKRSVFKLSAADIFATNHIAVIVQYQNQDWFTDRRWDSRFVTFSYTYRFGKNTVARARNRTTGVEDEKRRAN